MANDNQNGGASEAISKAASAAKTVQSAVKTGKAIAGAAKGAAAGGPYGAAAMAVWQNRKTVVKIIVAASFILLLPILFILMLPSLIFGGLNTDSPDIPVMNDNPAIYANIEDVNTKVNEVLTREHTAVLDKVQKLIDVLPPNAEHEIIDSFSVNSAYDTNVLISQYCAYKDNYEEISTINLITTIEAHKAKLFSHTVATETKEITRQKEVQVTKTVTEYVDSVVVDDKGNKRTEKIPVQKVKTVTEMQDETVTVTMHTYTISFVGADYFSNEVFRLNDEKAATARDFAENLVLFLDDRDNEGVPGNGSHKGIGDLIKDDTSAYGGGDFANVIENWKSHVTSEFGSRTDPITGNSSYHNGLDIGIPIGTPVYAAADGTVLYAKKLSTGYGYHIVINHGGKITTLYGHCSELLVSDGQAVKKGDVIAKSGSTGRSTGPHLHFEVMVDGVLKNPREYLP